MCVAISISADARAQYQNDKLSWPNFWIRIWSDCHGTTIERVNQKPISAILNQKEKTMRCLFANFEFKCIIIFVSKLSARGAHGNLLSTEETEFRMNCENLGPSHYNFWGHSRRILIMKNGPTTGYRKSRYKLLIYSVQNCGFVGRVVLSHLRAYVCANELLTCADLYLRRLVRNNFFYELNCCN